MKSDVLIIGSGAAGLSLALKLSHYNLNIILMSKQKLSESSTYYAQGGVAAVFDKTDSIESHTTDTLIAGAGICDEKAVKFITENARNSLEWLIENTNVNFDTVIKNNKQLFHLTKEGGHSHRRILHSADATGLAIQSSLQEQVQLKNNIVILEHHSAIDIIKSTKTKQAIGCSVLDNKNKNIFNILSKVTILATGGASKVYQYTSNPDISSGDGIAMAWRAGCRVANLEFNQFHPTCLYHHESRNFLLTEALRGEGAYLVRPDGTRFMQDYDDRKELAPRDIVARAIDFEMKKLGADCMYLDISHKDKSFIISHFPNIYHKLKNLNIDITKQKIPVVPAAHYTCGGVLVNLNGETDIPNLYAIGETSYTGLHGANRMASNSLLECIVMARSASFDILKKIPTFKEPMFFESCKKSNLMNSDEEVIIQHNWHELRLFMWDYMGIVRSDKRLARALRRASLLEEELQEYYSKYKITSNFIELRNLVLVSKLMIECALSRKESRGLHYNINYPFKDDEPHPTILKPKD